MNQDPPSTDLSSYFDVLIRRWRWVLAMPALAIVAAAFATAAVAPSYEATAVVALAPATLSIPISNQAPPYYMMVSSPRQLPTQYTATYYVALLKGAEVVNAVAPAAAATIASNASDRSLIEITARSSDAAVAAQTATRWATVGADRIAQVLRPSGSEAEMAFKALDATEQALVRFCQANSLDYDLGKLRNSPEIAVDKRLELDRLVRARDNAAAVYDEFARDLGESSILAASTWKPKVIAAAVPTAALAPRWIQNIGLGAGLGLMVGILCGFAVEYLVRKP